MCVVESNEPFHVGCEDAEIPNAEGYRIGKLRWRERRGKTREEERERERRGSPGQEHVEWRQEKLSPARR
jgi:hypothetical protein